MNPYGHNGDWEDSEEGAVWDIPEEEEEQSEESTRKKIISRVIKGMVGAALIGGLLYLSGGAQFFFFQQTPESVEQEQLQPTTQKEEITIPVTVFILRTEEGSGSQRTREDAERLVEQTSNIWGQAAINLEIESVETRHYTREEVQEFFADPAGFISDIPGRNPQAINVVLARNLQGLNGIAFSPFNTTAVADFTAGSYDFRTLAHEVGHILGLSHVSDKRYLMSQASRGVQLTDEEVETARATAQARFSP